MKITNWFPLVRLLHVPPEKKPRSQLKSRFTIFGKIVIESFFWLKQNAELTLELIRKLSSPCVGQQRQNCCDSASSGKFTSLKIIPSDCFEF